MLKRVLRAMSNFISKQIKIIVIVSLLVAIGLYQVSYHAFDNKKTIEANGLKVGGNKLQTHLDIGKTVSKELQTHLNDFYNRSFDITIEEFPVVLKGWTETYNNDTHKLFDVYKMKQPVYLPNYRNPCYWHEQQVKCLPRFMVIGMQKCGTTDLYEKLLLHPHVTAAKDKEPFFWNRGRTKGRTFSDYLHFFSTASTKIVKYTQERNGTVYHPIITGEASAGTIWDNHNWMALPENHNLLDPKYLASDAILHIIPDTRFILMVREPTDRLYSDYNFYNVYDCSTYNASAEDFHNRVSYGIQWLKDCMKTLSRRHCLFDPPARSLSDIRSNYYIGFFWNPVARVRLGLYSEYLEEWNAVFPAEQTLVIKLEDYSSNRIHALKKIYAHIGVVPLDDAYEDKVNHMKVQNKNIRSTPEPMWEETRTLLKDFYSVYNNKLAHMLNDTSFLWDT